MENYSKTRRERGGKQYRRRKCLVPRSTWRESKPGWGTEANSEEALNTLCTIGSKKGGAVWGGEESPL